MIHAGPLAATLLLASPASGCAHSDAGSGAVASECAGELDEAAVVAVLDRQREAWNAGDLDGFLAGYEQSEALLFNPNSAASRPARYAGALRAVRI